MGNRHTNAYIRKYASKAGDNRRLCFQWFVSYFYRKMFAFATSSGKVPANVGTKRTGSDQTFVTYKHLFSCFLHNLKTVNEYNHMEKADLWKHCFLLHEPGFPRWCHILEMIQIIYTFGCWCVCKTSMHFKSMRCTRIWHKLYLPYKCILKSNIHRFNVLHILPGTGYVT